MNAQEWLNECSTRYHFTVVSAEIDIGRATEIIRSLLADNERWKKAIEGLTPSGSEFVDDPENCAAYIRRMTQWPKQIAELKKDNAALRTRCEAAETELANIQAETANGGASCHQCMDRTRREAFRECAEIAEKIHCESMGRLNKMAPSQQIVAAIRERGKV